MQNVSVRHALGCGNGGLVVARYNEICDNIINFYRQAFSPNCVYGKPLIYLVCSRSEEEVRHGGSVPEKWGGMSIQFLWEIRAEVVINVRFGNSNAETWKPEVMHKIFISVRKNQEGQSRTALLSTMELFFSVFLLGWWDDRQGVPSRTCHFESNHGRENGWNHFAC